MFKFTQLADFFLDLLSQIRSVPPTMLILPAYLEARCLQLSEIAEKMPGSRAANYKTFQRFLAKIDLKISIPSRRRKSVSSNGETSTIRSDLTVLWATGLKRLKRSLPRRWHRRSWLFVSVRPHINWTRNRDQAKITSRRNLTAMMRLSEIHIRDPFVLPVSSEGRYYLYGTMGKYTWGESGVGFDCYTSTDLKHWDGPFPVFRPPADFWADRNFWAPEIHVVHGRYFMFASFKAEGICRGTQILAAESPCGPFLPLSAGPVTPPDWECLDGTLCVTTEGDPWMVFCHEWVQVGDGEICAIPLNKDLVSTAGEPVVLFCASQAPWAQQLDSKGRKGYVTDGPWMHRLPSGELLMLWSSFCAGGYTIGVARSPSGQLRGPWQQEPLPLYKNDGGHCMTFWDFDGNLQLSFHHPNGYPNERPIFLPLSEEQLVSPDGMVG